MKTCTMPNGKVVSTPWLNTAEAILYTGISRRRFAEAVEVGLLVPGREKMFNCKELDRFLEGKEKKKGAA